MYSSTAGEDYIPLVSALIMFSQGSAQDNTTSCINFTVLNDNTVEDTEFLFTTLSTLLSSVLISPTMNLATIYIFEDPNDCKLITNPSVFMK